MISDAMTKRQQHKITIDDMDIDTVSEVNYCFCCFKPLVEKDSGTRQIEFENGFLESISVSRLYKDSIIYKEQFRLLKQNNNTIVHICFVCEPSIKISLSEWDQNKTVSYFSGFIVDTLLYIDNISYKIDKNSLWKGLLCLSSTVTKSDENDRTYYNRVRDKKNEVLEGCIAVLRYAFRKTGQNLRDMDMCLYQVCSVIRWKFSGMLTYVEEVGEDMHYYKKSIENKKLRKIIDELWPCVEYTQSLKFLRSHRNCMCSGCMFETERAVLDKEREISTYASMFNMQRVKIHEHVQHYSIKNSSKPVQLISVVCFCTNSISFRSYTYYRELSRAFPLEFQENDIHDYYNYLARMQLLKQN